jgi:hypothetical protein
MRKTHREVPRFYLTCDCEHDLTSYCQAEQHEPCHRAEPQASHEGYITNRRDQVLYFREAYEHPTTTGPYYERAAMVWLAGRVCRWACPCTCHTATQVQESGNSGTSELPKRSTVQRKP